MSSSDDNRVIKTTSQVMKQRTDTLRQACDKDDPRINKFFKWKKVLIRSIHLTLVLFVSGNLFVQKTTLREALVLRNYPYLISFVVLVYLSLLFYFLTCLLDPGYVENLEPENKNSTSNIKLRYCDYCQIEQPIRSRHCEECQRCIRKFDHHCPWLVTCIGERNHRYFWIFLGSTFALSLWCIVITIESFNKQKLWSDWFRSNLLYLFNMQVLIIACLVTLALFIVHTYFMLNNTTTWERFSRRHITYLRIIKNDKFNPFAQGYMRNIYLFFCNPRSNKWDNVYATFIKSKHRPMEDEMNSSSSNEVEIKMDEIIAANSKTNVTK